MSSLKLLSFGVDCVLFSVLLWCSETGFVFIIDHANLLFHEAGHVFAGFLSNRLETYGGTIGQLVFPSAVMISCWRKGQLLGVAAGAIWFFENFLNIARYMADARRLVLPLVGGGDHDWNTILNRWDILHYDDRIASVVQYAGWVGMFLALAWVAWQAWQQRHTLKQARFPRCEPDSLPESF